VSSPIPANCAATGGGGVYEKEFTRRDPNKGISAFISQGVLIE
jgi:hypothetical protein